MDVWDIVDGYEEAPPSSMNSKVLKEYQRHVKKVMSIIGLNLADNQLAHIKSCKGPAKVWKTFCNIPATKSLSNNFLIYHRNYKRKHMKELREDIFAQTLPYIKF